MNNIQDIKLDDNRRNLDEILKRFDELKKEFLAVKNNQWWASDEDYIKQFIQQEITKALEEVVPVFRDLGQIISDSEGSFYPTKEDIAEENGWNACREQIKQNINNYLK